ncbi:MAG: hypothetical protein IT561_04335 [Alphaproteobacteria bacterium]|nr:hypothetical protein [Alphaproteobacteria bacterium]
MPGVAGAEHDLPPPNRPLRLYVICASPRSGSTLLAALLRATGRMGVPAEYFNPLHLQPALAARFGVALPDGRVRGGAYLAALQRHRTSAEGVFGAKIFFSQFQDWGRNASFRRLLAEATLVRLRRRDTLGQAISLALAQATGAWNAAAGAAAQSQARAPAYDSAALRRALGIVLAEEAGWDAVFAANGRTPIAIAYEDLVADPDAACRPLFAALGLAGMPTLSLAEPPTRPMAGPAADAWRRAWVDGLRLAAPDPG